MKDRKLKELLAKYKEGTCTDEEKALLENWVSSVTYPEFRISEEELLADLADIRRRLPLVRTKERDLRPRIAFRPRIAVAASIVLALGIGFYFVGGRWFGNEFTITVSQPEILPGGNKATLTLPDGRSIRLSEEKRGIVVNAGELTYEDGTRLGEGVRLENVVPGTVETETGGGAELQQVALTTPVGGQYQVALPDGSKVWLNANSTLRYPVGFTSGERVVELIGEAYFDVETDKSRPFQVVNNGQVVVVLGTEFNISAYPDDPEIKTTLVEGRVRLSLVKEAGAPSSMVLAPGEQAILTRGEFTKSDADIEATVAWKNGMFVFNNNLRHTLDQISRWYDVEIEYQAAIGEDITLIGKVSRNMKLNSLLGYIEAAAGDKVHFTLRERRVIVTK